MSSEYQVSVESAKIRFGPFTINVEQDRTVNLPSSKPDDKVGRGDIVPGLSFLAESLHKAGLDVPVPQPRVINLRCKRCHIAEVMIDIEGVREFMLMHAEHPVEMVP